MILIKKIMLQLGCSALLCLSHANAQSAQQQGIASTTQILDTSVLFAIGAREAEQAIRGSFGWPTFQEGFVDRVYFRFDPDGYARFSTSPRLDEDVFEVICAESSTACIAKKPSLEIGLTVEGRIQIKIGGINPEDTFFVSDRKSELPLPPTILEPLDARLETLLASGGHLVVKREVETLQEISLAGFSAVATYLRWVAQGQSPRVFPRGWPVPAQVGLLQNSGLTQPGAWVAPNPGPQQTQTTYAQQNQFNGNGAFSGGAGGIQNPLNGGFQQQFGAAPTGNLTQGLAGFGNRQQLVAGQDGHANAGLDATQSAIQALQQELAQLRASQQNGITQPAAQVQDEFAKGFAQQAQARNLPLPVGYGAELETSLVGSSNDTQGNNFATQPVGGPKFQAPAPSVASPDLRLLDQRVYALERAMIDMRSAFEIVQKMQNQVQVHARIPAPAPAVEPVLAAREPIVQNEPTSLDALEKLLLERLGKREEPVTPPVPVIETAVNPDRKMVMDLLKQLEGGNQTAVVEPAIVEQTQQAAEPAKEGFVTLSDYINQMLKSETPNETAGQ